MHSLKSRHLIFIGMAIVVITAMSLNLKTTVVPSADTLRMYNYLASLPTGSVLMVSFDHEASSLPEIQPLAVAFLRHAYSRGLRLIGVALLAEGTGIGYNLMQEIAKEYDCNYGVDYVYLGYKPQWVAAIISMGESIKATFPRDYLDSSYSNFPMLNSITNYDDLAGVISIADGSLTTHWIEYGNARYSVRVSAFVAAAMITTYDPYLESGQLYSMVGGLRGAAEYEQLIKIGGSGSRGMVAQTWTHLYVVLLILLGNLLYFRNRSRKEIV